MVGFEFNSKLSILGHTYFRFKFEYRYDHLEHCTDWVLEVKQPIRDHPVMSIQHDRLALKAETIADDVGHASNARGT